MKSNSNIKPSTFLDLGNGNTHYNFNVVESKDTDGNPTFNYDTVEIAGKPNYDALVKAVIHSNWDADKEFSLRNNFERCNLGMADESYKTVYIDYLTRVDEIKAMVKNDLKES